MADSVQWIKLKVGMFDGNSFKKIKHAKIGGISYRDKLTAIWFELMDLAGKSNANGYLIDNNEIPYQSLEDIAIMLDREEREIELCMQFFINEKMVEIINDVYCLTNFTKYQNQQGLERIREQKRIAQAKWRNKKRQALLGENNTNHICAYCGEYADTIDHIIARHNGGTDVSSNIVPACRRCNSTKNDWDLLKFLNDPFSTFIKKELILSNPKLNVIFNESTGKYEYVDIYKTSTDNLPSNSYSISNSNNIYIQDNIEKEEENITKEEKEKDQTLVDDKDGMTYCQPTNISVKTNSRSLNRALSSYINECFDKTWKFVVNKKSKVYAQTTYLKKLKSCKTEADIKTKAKYILTKYVESKKEWEDENTELKYIPMFSTWLNRNIEDGVIHEEDL